VAEILHKKSFIGINWCAHELSNTEVDLMAEAFRKVWANLELLGD
jgi:hypothetical protein